VSEWGSDYDDLPAVPSPPAPEAATLLGERLGGIADELVEQAVQAAVQQQVAQIAKTAVEEALTPQLLEQLRVTAVQTASRAIAAAPESSVSSPGPEGIEETPPALYFGSVDEFVREYLIHHYKRPVSDRGGSAVWAPDWWSYEEAIDRLEALWRAWEFLRLDPSTGMSVWWRDHADHHMAVLLSPDGPFRGASGKCDRGEPLPYTAPPAGLFPDVRLESQ